MHRPRDIDRCHDVIRYVGNLRAINAGLLDAYLLKSLDGFSITPTMNKYVMVKCGDGRKKICLFRKGAPIQQRRSKNSKANGDAQATSPPPPIQMIELGLYSTRDTWAVDLVERLRKEGVVVTYDVQASDSKLLLGAAEANLQDDAEAETDAANEGGGIKPPQTLADGFLSVQSKTVSVNANFLANETLVDLLTELARRSGTPHPLVYDRVVRCLGWKHDNSPYAHDTKPLMQPNGKYAVMTSEYESVNVPGMYFAGTLSHGKDWLRSAGGFIHGFRYTSRALFRILEAKRAGGRSAADNHARDSEKNWWPATTVFPLLEVWDGTAILRPNGCDGADWTGIRGGGSAESTERGASNGDGDAGDAGAAGADGYEYGKEYDSECDRFEAAPQAPFTRFLDKVFDRINTASGPYQMVAVLGDGVVFQCAAAGNDAGTTAPPSITGEYLEEIPISYFNAQYSDQPRLIWHFGYEQQRQSLHDSRRKGTLFQIHIWFHSGDCGGGEGKRAPNEFKEVLRIGEDLNTNWGAYETRVRVGEWIYTKLSELRKAPSLNADAALAAAAAAAAKHAQEKIDQKVGAARVLADVKQRRQAHTAACIAGADDLPECTIARHHLEAAQAAAIAFVEQAPAKAAAGGDAHRPRQVPRKHVDVTALLPDGVTDGNGDIPDIEPWAEELQRCNSARAWKVYGDTGDTGGHSRKQAICALQLGRRW